MIFLHNFQVRMQIKMRMEHASRRTISRMNNGKLKMGLSVEICNDKIGKRNTDKIESVIRTVFIFALGEFSDSNPALN